MTSNSATTINLETGRLFSDMGSESLVNWIQDPVSRQVFEQSNQIIDGIYVQVVPSVDLNSVLGELAREFAAWDAASDEALLNFEKENL